jgi:hypothetical protein
MEARRIIQLLVIPGPSAVLSHIEELLTAPVDGVDAPTLAHVEDTLTEGYALALALEGERWRVERRFGEVARALEGPDISGSAVEIASLANRLASVGRELEHLRAQLRSLRDRARVLRAVPCAAAPPR